MRSRDLVCLLDEPDYVPVADIEDIPSLQMWLDTSSHFFGPSTETLPMGMFAHRKSPELIQSSTMVGQINSGKPPDWTTAKIPTG